MHASIVTSNFAQPHSAAHASGVMSTGSMRGINSMPNSSAATHQNTLVNPISSSAVKPKSKKRGSMNTSQTAASPTQAYSQMLKNEVTKSQERKPRYQSTNQKNDNFATLNQEYATHATQF
jgi:hypothetical protein